MRKLSLFFILIFSLPTWANCPFGLLAPEQQWLELIRMGLPKKFVGLDILLKIRNFDSPPEFKKPKGMGGSSWHKSVSELRGTLQSQLSKARWEELREQVYQIAVVAKKIEDNKGKAEVDTDVIFVPQFGEVQSIRAKEGEILIDNDGNAFWIFLEGKIPKNAKISYLNLHEDGRIDLQRVNPKTNEVKRASTKAESSFNQLTNAYLNSYPTGQKSVVFWSKRDSSEGDVWEIPLDTERLRSEVVKIENGIGAHSGWQCKSGDWSLRVYSDSVDSQTKYHGILSGNNLEYRRDLNGTPNKFYARPDGEPYFMTRIYGAETVVSPDGVIEIKPEDIGFTRFAMRSGSSAWVNKNLLWGRAEDLPGNRHLVILNPFAKDKNYLVRSTPVSSITPGNPIFIPHFLYGSLLVFCDLGDLKVLLDEGEPMVFPWHKPKQAKDYNGPFLGYHWEGEDLILDAFYKGKGIIYQRVKLYGRGKSE